MLTRDIHKGYTYNCVCDEVHKTVQAVIKKMDRPQYLGDTLTYTVKCNRKNCPRGNASACIMYASEIISEFTNVNTLGNFPKKNQQEV
jgi:hypothetical protein